jgi:hypothetical protein
MYSLPPLYHAAVCASTRDDTQNTRVDVSEEVTQMEPCLGDFGKNSRLPRTLFQEAFVAIDVRFIQANADQPNQPSQVESQVLSMLVTVGLKTTGAIESTAPASS